MWVELMKDLLETVIEKIRKGLYAENAENAENFYTPKSSSETAGGY